MSNEVEDAIANLGFEPELVDQIKTIGRLKRVKEGQVLISPDSGSNEMPLVITGLLKVMREDENGEVFLYYIEGGETCAMSITCCIEGEKTASYKVVASADSTVWMIPMTYLDSWIARYPLFR